MNAKWMLVNAVLRRVFGRDMVRPSGEHLTLATLVIDERTLAILEDVQGGGESLMRVQLRASLTPNDVGKMVSAINYLYPCVFGPVFEMNEQGELLTGDKALQYVWGGMPMTISDSVFNDKTMTKQYAQPN